MTIANLLGNLPEGTTIKIGSGASKALAGSSNSKTISSPPGPQDCDPATEKWSFKDKQCIPRMYVPKEGAGLLPKIGAGIGEIGSSIRNALTCGVGFRPNPEGRGCVPIKAAPTAEGPPSGKWQPGKTVSGTYDNCIDSGGTPEYCASLEYEGGEESPPPADTTDTGGGDGGRQYPKYEPSPIQGETPSPFDNPQYYSWLTQSGIEEEKAYWDTQQQIINRTYDEGWMQLEAELATMGATYGTESAEIKAIYTRDRELALRSAYNEIMYTGLQRRAEQRKQALDFYTNNRSMELTYAIQQGQLTVEMLKTYISAEVAYAGIEVDMLDAITNQALARSTIDMNTATIYQNFMLIAMQLGLSNAEANNKFNELLAQYGGTQKSQLM